MRDLTITIAENGFIASEERMLGERRNEYVFETAGSLSDWILQWGHNIQKEVDMQNEE